MLAEDWWDVLRAARRDALASEQTGVTAKTDATDEARTAATGRMAVLTIFRVDIVGISKVEGVVS